MIEDILMCGTKFFSNLGMIANDKIYGIDDVMVTVSVATPIFIGAYLVAEDVVKRARKFYKIIGQKYN